MNFESSSRLILDAAHRPGTSEGWFVLVQLKYDHENRQMLLTASWKQSLFLIYVRRWADSYLNVYDFAV